MKTQNSYEMNQIQSKQTREEGSPPHDTHSREQWLRYARSSDPPQRTASVSGDDAPPRSESEGRNRNRCEWTPEKDSPSSTTLSRPLHFHNEHNNPDEWWWRIRRTDWRAEDWWSNTHCWLLRCAQPIQAHLQFTTQFNSHSQSSHHRYPEINI